jgi:hypothetical protein
MLWRQAAGEAVAVRWVPMSCRGREVSIAAMALFAVFLAAPATATTPDYALLDAVLLANVRNGYVDYDGIAKNPKFAEFVRQLGLPPDHGDAAGATLAYDINAYNAFAISGVLQGHSPATRSGRARLFRKLRFRLAGEEVTLDELEHERIRAAGDVRSRFAIVCASLSCPRLANRAFRPETLDAQLDEAARRFVNDATRNQYDIAQRTAFVSAIFDRYEQEFLNAAGSVPAWLARYVEEPASRAALLEGRLSIRHLPDDWDLNGRFEGPPRD